MRSLIYAVLIVVGVTFLTSCATIYTEFQSAKTVGEGNSEITPTISGVWAFNEGESRFAQTNIGMQYAYGVHDGLDLRLRYEMVFPDETNTKFGDINVIAIAPKVSLVENQLAYYMPVGFAFGEDIETADTYEVHPTLIFTHSFSEQVEFNISGKYIFPFDSERDNLVAFNVSLGGFGNNTIIRPSAGILLNPGESGVFFDVGLGVSFPF